MPPRGTKHRILNAAEALFAERGFEATSLRAITTSAEANLAAVNYHFGSKQELVKAVLERRVRPMNEERLRLLHACEAEAGGGNPTLESILAAFLKPPFEMCHRQNGGGAVIVRLFGRTYTEPGDELWKLFIGQFREVLERFGSALSRALPELPRRELFWRMHFMVATLIQTLADMRRLEMISGGECDPTDFDAAVERLVPFLAAGLRAPLPAGAIGGKGAELT